jgi:subtilase family serine protease
MIKKETHQPDRKVDYVPVETKLAYCDVVAEDGDMYLQVTLKNQGSHDATATSTTTVTFSTSSGDVQNQQTVFPLSAGQTFTFKVLIPKGCYNADCNFSISVDDFNDVSETDEMNNKVNGHCVG